MSRASGRGTATVVVEVYSEKAAATLMARFSCYELVKHVFIIHWSSRTVARGNKRSDFRAELSDAMGPWIFDVRVERYTWQAAL